MKIALVANRLREKIAFFSGELSKNLSKPARRFVGEMIYGMQAKGSVRLSEIARSLEESIALKKTIDRLSNNLGRIPLGGHLQKNILTYASPMIERNDLLILDTTDIAKPYARKMEHLGRIYDGSEHKTANGYPIITVIGASRDGRRIIPLYGELYSHQEPGFVSENAEILKAISTVSEHTRGKGIWVIDRGGDREILLHGLLKRREDFIIRMRGDRHMHFNYKWKEMMDVAQRRNLPYRDYLIREDADGESGIHIEFGFVKVRIRFRHEQLYMVIVRGFGEKPLLLLTTLPMKKNRKVLWGVIQSYLARWKVEETIRFAKQSLELEDVRVLRYVRLKNLMQLVIAVMLFGMTYLGVKTKLQVLAGHVYRAAKRIFGIPDFRYYALADGIKTILQRSSKRPPVTPDTPDPQLLLPL